jgi:uncharacterized protein YmfQ (DUF2313 family)
MRSAAAYREQLQALLPPGPAWSRDGESTLGKLLFGMADGLARVDDRSAALIEEADPLTTLEMLPDWERAVGLPDPCVPISDIPRERRIAVARKLAGLGGQSRAYFIELAALVGLEVEIVEFQPFTCDSRVDAEMGGDEWRFAFLVRMLPPSESIGDAFQLRFVDFTTESGVDERLRTFGSQSLECLIARARPAHSYALFAYPDDPEPALWFDFTTP